MKWDLFNPLYPKEKISRLPLDRGYVSDSLNNSEISKWHEQMIEPPFHCHKPVFISAQAGQGKNYFITHTLREYGLKHGEKILYISNRVALDYQQKRDLAELTHNTLTVSENWEDREDFGNVTVITYHKLYNKLCSENSSEWFHDFTYVILDECHFFYSDALFYPYTWDILRQIPSVFEHCIRIYMSATFEDVLEPIRYHEGCSVIDRPFNSIYYYDSQRDFSAYKANAFKTTNQIIEIIRSDKSDDKWVICVSSIASGRKMAKELNDAHKDTTFIDSNSRHSNDPDEISSWLSLRQNGKFGSKILITTSVLDNGFSVKDKKIKNIVLFTHDRTEFIQELGRCRLEDKQSVNLYFKKLSSQDFAKLKKTQKQFEDVICDFYGNEDTRIGNSFVESGNSIEVVKRLWTPYENQCRGFISLGKYGDNKIVPHINLMARWRTMQLKAQIEEYELLLNEHPDNTDVLFKARWLGKGISDVIDFDIDKKEQAREKLMSLLIDKSLHEAILVESTNSFKSFSEEFEANFCTVYPDYRATNRGKDRGYLKHKAINNRLKDMSADPKNTHKFQLHKDGNGWKVVEQTK